MHYSQKIVKAKNIDRCNRSAIYGWQDIDYQGKLDSATLGI